MNNVVLSTRNIDDLINDIANKVVFKLSSTESKPLAYSKKEFAEAIGKSESFVDQERRAGRLSWKRNGGTVSIPATELEKYI